MNKEESYNKIKEIVQIKLNYYEKIKITFPARSHKECKEIKAALNLLEEWHNSTK